jgi:hypothetical protein
MKIATFGVLLIGVAVCHAAADEVSDAELRKVEGRWERIAHNAAGTRFRIVKDVAGELDTVTTFDDLGNILDAHTSTFKLEKRGPVRVFSFYNVVVTAGINKGHIEAATSSYIYRVDDETFTEVWGMLEGDKRHPNMLIWRRMKEEK